MLFIVSASLSKLPCEQAASVKLRLSLGLSSVSPLSPVIPIVATVETAMGVKQEMVGFAASNRSGCGVHISGAAPVRRLLAVVAIVQVHEVTGDLLPIPPSATPRHR